MTDTADVVVVGAGIFGTSIAFQLVRRGAGRVVLIDRHGPASGASGRSFEQVRRHYSNELTIRMADRGFEMFANWAGEVGVGDPGYVALGYLLLVDEASVDACRRNVDLGRRCGVDTRFVTPEEIAAIEPLISLEQVAGGAFEPDGGVIDVRRMILSWLVGAMLAGLVVGFDEPVLAITVDAGKVTGVRTPRREIAAPVVVNAAGCWAAELVRPLGLDLPISFAKIQMAYLRQPAGRPMLRTLVTDSAGGLVVRPDRGPIALAVAYEPGRPLQGHPDDDAGVEPGYEPFLRSVLEARLPAYRDAEWLGGVAGPYDVTPDWHPILGPAPGIDGLYLAVGWSGHGLKLSPAVGEIVADALLGRTPAFDVEALGLERFERGEPMYLAYGPGARA